MNEYNNTQTWDKELRKTAITYIVRNIKPQGNLSTLRNLQKCFFAGHNHGRLLTQKEIQNVNEMHQYEKTTRKTFFVLCCGLFLIIGVVVGKL